jgi:hypothetical protein
MQPAEQLGIHAGDAGGSFAQTLSIGIFADRREDFSNGPGDPRLVDLSLAGSVQFLVGFAVQAAARMLMQIGD